MTKVMNISNGPRGIRLASGLLAMLGAGQVADDLDLAAGEQEGDSDWFLFDDDIAANEHRQPVDETAQVANDDALAALRADFDTAFALEHDLRVKAEADLDEARDLIVELKGKLAAFDRDGDGNPGDSEKQDLPALFGKKKEELLKIAADEGVTIDEGTAYAAIMAAIKAKRAGA